MKAIREQLLSLDFKESFVGKLLKDYPAEKIKEKFELLLAKKNINRPAGWLLAALKNDYQDEEEDTQGHLEKQGCGINVISGKGRHLIYHQKVKKSSPEKKP